MTYALVIDPAQAALAPVRAAQRPATTRYQAADHTPTSDGASDFMAHLRAGVDYARGRVFHDHPALSRPRAQAPLTVHTDPVHDAPLVELVRSYRYALLLC